MLGRANLAVFKGRRWRLCGAPACDFGQPGGVVEWASEETEEGECGDLIGVVMEGYRGLNGH